MMLLSMASHGWSDQAATTSHLDHQGYSISCTTKAIPPPRLLRYHPTLRMVSYQHLLCCNDTFSRAATGSALPANPLHAKSGHWAIIPDKTTPSEAFHNNTGTLQPQGNHGHRHHTERKTLCKPNRPQAKERASLPISSARAEGTHGSPSQEHDVVKHGLAAAMHIAEASIRASTEVAIVKHQLSSTSSGCDHCKVNMAPHACKPEGVLFKVSDRAGFGLWLTGEHLQEKLDHVPGWRSHFSDVS
eukprot:jgi/Ulvmu1/6345/UM029_0053.1